MKENIAKPRCSSKSLPYLRGSTQNQVIKHGHAMVDAELSATLLDVS
jgi:hypothetical protein